MSTPNDGGPAFPRLVRLTNPDQLNSTRCESTDGMSLRDYFAEGVDFPWEAVRHSLKLKYPERGDYDFTFEEFAAARAMYKYCEADAMLAQRAPPPEKAEDAP